jgi:hypothetical protein
MHDGYTALAWGLMMHRARCLTRNLGFRVAAGYLRNRDVPFHTAYLALFNRLPPVSETRR